MIFSKKFWIYFPGGVAYVDLETWPDIFDRWRGLLWTGTAVAGQKPCQHVCRGRPLSAAGRSFGGSETQTASAAAGDSGYGNHHRGGVGHGIAGKPQLPGLGLPGTAG